MPTHAKRSSDQRLELFRAPRQDTTSASALRALVVDDCRDVADGTALFLSMAGLETEAAYDGLDALKRVQMWNPHICVLDLAMPPMNGFELAYHIREFAGPRLLLIAVTGWVNPRNQSGALEAGFDCFMSKPVSPENLLRVIQGQLFMWPDAVPH